MNRVQDATLNCNQIVGTIKQQCFELQSGQRDLRIESVRPIDGRNRAH